jgi:hypothetical protein
MARRQYFSGKNVIVTVTIMGGPPIPIELAKEDKAVTLKNTEKPFGDPSISLDGKDGCHNEQCDGHGDVTVIVPPFATETIRVLETIKRGKLSCTISGKDVGTQLKAFSADNCVMSDPPEWAAGAKNENLTYVFTYLSSDQSLDGPLTLPV